MKISLSLNPKSINRAIKELNAYKKWVEQKAGELTERLAIVGTAEAAKRFGAAIYDGDNDVRLTARPSDKGWVIEATGQAVCFIEFGAGVYFNSAEPYPEPRPGGIVGIGEYGKGKGKGQGWAYYNGDDLVFTRGNPASMPMYFAKEEIQRQIQTIAREVFS